jgi:hypothetical protein
MIYIQNLNNIILVFMGNQQNYDPENILEKFSNSIKTKVKSFKKNSYMELDTKSSSNYSGIRTNTTDHDNEYDNDDDNDNDDSLKGEREIIHSQSISSSSEEKNENNSKNFNNKNVSIIFEWKEPASTVYLIGSFGNWKQRFIMDKSGISFRLKLVFF